MCCENGLRLALLLLGQRLADADNGGDAVLQAGACFLGDERVGFGKEATALGVADQGKAAA